ncbi:MAG: Ig-like domain-containing protein, partial [Firmicutes bacterium]|nr:Ig-like domain-containing protein [Bacillota bacterium]
MFKPHDEMLHDDMEQKMEAGLTPELPGDAEFDEAAYDEGALLGADLAKLLAEEKELLEMLSAPADFAARIEAAVAAADAAEAAAAPAPKAETAPQQPTKVYVPKKKKSPVKMLASLAAVAVLAIGLIGFGGGLFGGGGGGQLDGPVNIASAISISAAVADDDGMDTASPFVIRANEPIEEELVELALVIEPAIEYELKAADGGKTWQVIPTDELAEDAVYKLSFDPQRALAGLPARAANVWAFQTRADFAIAGTLPAHHGTQVPTSSGIAIAFTNSVDMKQVADGLSIEPDVNYELSASGDQVYLLPLEALQENTVYTVTIPAGIKNAEGTEALTEAYSFSFQTGTVNYNDQNWRYSFDFANEGVSFAPGEVPAFHVYTSANTQLDVSIWQLKDAEQYYEAISYGESRNWWCYSSTNQPYPTDGLALIEQRTLATGGSSSWQSTLTLEREFEPGYYLLTATNVNGYTSSIVFQVSELAAYAAFGPQDVLVWLHELDGGAAVKGATVSALDGSLKGTATTDADDVAIALNGPVDENLSSRQTILIEADGRELVLSRENYDRFYAEGSYGIFGLKNDYWGYIYTDRVLYRPGETVQFFGIFDSRGEAADVDQAVLKLQGGSNLYGDSAIIIPVEVKDGVISGSYEMPQLNSGYYNFSLHKAGDTDGAELASCYFMVDYYSTSSYEFSISNNKAVFMAGETLESTLTANYFEGSPLPDLGVSLTTNYDYGNAYRKSTDGAGEAVFSIKLPQLRPNSLTSNYSLSYTTSEAQMGDQWHYDSVTVFNWNVYPQFEYERSKDNKLDITITPYDIDLSGAEDLPSTHYYGLDPSQFYKPFSGSLPFEVVVERQEMVEHSETYLDEYTMQSVTNTWTERVPVVEDRFSITVDGVEELQLQLESDWNYYIYLNGQDKAGRPIQAQYYIYTGLPAANTGGPDDEFDARYVYLSVAPDQQGEDYDGRLAIGESATFHLTDGYARTLPAAVGGDTLYFRYAEGVEEYTVGANDGAGYTLTYEEEFAPAVGLIGVWFDGYQYVYSYGHSVWYDKAAQELTLDITADAEEYAPGAEVKLALLLKDAAGNPIEGTVNLSMVDEALLALADQQVNFLNNIYYNYNLAYYQGISSNIDLDDSGMAEGGGEGDGERKDFADTAYFGTVKTGKDGRAEVSFTLPDNITRWRLVWHGYNHDANLVKAGSGEESIISTLPFFIDYDLADTFRVGDQPTVAIRSGGEKSLAEGGDVSYTIAIDQLDFSQQLTAKAGERIEVSLPQLPLGNYEISIIGEMGEYKDWVTRSFSVVESFSAYVAKEAELLKEGTGLNGSDELLTTLVFGNDERASLILGLIDLAYGDGVRLEQRLASLVAREYLAEYFGREELLPDEEEMQQLSESLLAYHTYTGGLASFTYGDSAYYVSALAASAGAEHFSTDTLIS